MASVGLTSVGDIISSDQRSEQQKVIDFYQAAREDRRTRGHVKSTSRSIL